MTAEPAPPRPPGSGARASPREAVFELHPNAPYRLDLTCWALRRRRKNRVDTWDGRYRRSLLVRGHAVAVEVEQRGGRHDPVLVVRAWYPSALADTPSTGAPPTDPVPSDPVGEIDRQVRLLLGVDVDLTPFYRMAEDHPRLRELRDRFLGVRPPRFPTLFESLANAVANQQLSLEVGIELLNRLCEAFGERAATTDLVAFPDAAAIAAAAPADLRALGFSERKAHYLIGMAHAVDRGDIDVVDLETAERDEAVERLLALRGIGRWSAEYVLLRGAGRIDVFPGDDVGARNKLQRLMELDHPPGYEEIGEIVAPWDPAAGMVYFHLLLDGLDRKGELDGEV